MQVSSKPIDMTRRWALKLYLTLASLIFLGILTQGFLIGVTLFAGAGWGGNAHAINGLVVLILTLLLPLAGLPARLPGRLTILSAVLFILTLIQVIFTQSQRQCPIPGSAASNQRHAAVWVNPAAHHSEWAADTAERVSAGIGMALAFCGLAPPHPRSTAIGRDGASGADGRSENVAGDPTDQQLTVALAAVNPWLLTAICVGGFAISLWLMMFKPF